MNSKMNTPPPSENSGGNPSQKPNSELPARTGKREGVPASLRERKRRFREKRRQELAANPPKGALELVGSWSNSLFVIKRIDTTFVLCRCVCGKEKPFRLRSVQNGEAKSCGCQRKRYLQEAARKRVPDKVSCHNEYRIFHQMKQRCYNPKDSTFKSYGGRGIQICDRWLASYAAFLEDMGPRPSTGHSVDRIDNEKGYSPENCRWATTKEQANNTRTTSWLTLNGERKTSTEWEELLFPSLGLTKQNIADRKYWGWSDERILTTPVKHPKRNNANAS